MSRKNTLKQKSEKVRFRRRFSLVEQKSKSIIDRTYSITHFSNLIKPAGATRLSDSMLY
ncbi:hypothetical protein AALP_AAs45790U000100 [Arabis alpina]|uniref:Uncharacterized protein n=1 Tax=Arabis alpina TaxID=50452 RepID=A0A087G2I7_ARAAL|nr:hypothetical protein AALP_AAs45790U000100 [Arabis alpina]